MFKYIPVQKTVTVVLIFGVIDFFSEEMLYFSFQRMEENCDWIGNPARCTFDSKQNRIVPDANIIPIIPEKKHSSYNWRISCKNRYTKTGQIFVLRNRIFVDTSQLGSPYHLCEFLWIYKSIKSMTAA